MRKLIIEVECGKKTCGSCNLVQWEYKADRAAGVVGYCAAFGTKRSKDTLCYNVTSGRRCPACLAAEENAALKADFEYKNEQLGAAILSAEKAEAEAELSKVGQAGAQEISNQWQKRALKAEAELARDYAKPQVVTLEELRHVIHRADLDVTATKSEVIVWLREIGVTVVETPED